MLGIGTLCAPTKKGSLIKAVLTAVRIGNTGEKDEVVQLLETPNININEQSPTLGNTALHIAVAQGHKEIVELLLVKNPDLNIQNIDCKTPLHIAAEKGKNVVVTALLNKNAIININTLPEFDPLEAYKLLSSEYGFTPLGLALTKRHVETAKLLINNGAHIDIMDLQLAVESQNIPLVELILNQIDIQEYNNWKKYALGYPLEFAAKKGLNQIVELLIKKEPEAQEMINTSTALEFAALGGHVDTVKLLLQWGAYDNDDITLQALQASIHSRENQADPTLLNQEDNVPVINHTDSYLARIYQTRDKEEYKNYYNNIPWEKLTEVRLSIYNLLMNKVSTSTEEIPSIPDMSTTLEGILLSTESKDILPLGNAEVPHTS